jgi:hypothetical protein
MSQDERNQDERNERNQDERNERNQDERNQKEMKLDENLQAPC